ncbi:MAG: preprotein translocase subunit SecG [Defluviimonas sp.]|nr:preprotein translocase subunit SecG [Defluviimonas sp.]
MENVILTVHLILALLLIGVVLLQRSEGGGLGMGGGGGSGVMSGRQAANALSKLTWIFAAAFIATSLTLTVLAARDASSGSVVDRLGTGAPDAAAPATPALPEIELPPPSRDAPAAPPAAD